MNDHPTPPPTETPPSGEDSPITIASAIGEPAPEAELKPRLERLGGEPAPDITPEEFVRLQQSGQIHIDPRGRVRSSRAEESDAGITLRKRRAWYGSKGWVL
jgi:hypothetical protein